MINFEILGLGLVIAVIIYYLMRIPGLRLNPSSLYSGASAFCFTVFFMAVKFSLDPIMGWGPAHTWTRLPYGTYPIWMLGFLSLGIGLMFLSKSIEINRRVDRKV